MPELIRIEDIRAEAEVFRSTHHGPLTEIVLGESVILEAWYFQAVEVVFDAIPEHWWIVA